MSEDLRCTWHEYKRGRMDTCGEPAIICVISGCLNGHLEEFVTCWRHFDIWTQWVADDENPVSRCMLGDCLEHIDSWERTDIKSLSAGYALYMKTRQPPTRVAV